MHLMQPLVETRYITASEADDILERWASQSVRVCFAVCFGDPAWHVHWVGPMHGGQKGGWIQTVDHMTNVLRTDHYEEITLLDDEELLGIRFRNLKGSTAGSFAVCLFIDKLGDIDKKSASLLKRMIH